MSARTRLTPAEFAALQRRRQASAEAAAKGRAHRALPLDEVERRAQAARKPWPMTCSACNTGTPGECDCMPVRGFDAPEFLADPPKPRPPAYPWRAFGAWFLIVFALLGGAHAVGVLRVPASQVAQR